MFVCRRRCVSIRWLDVWSLFLSSFSSITTCSSRSMVASVHIVSFCSFSAISRWQFVLSHTAHSQLSPGDSLYCLILLILSYLHVIVRIVSYWSFSGPWQVQRQGKLQQGQITNCACVSHVVMSCQTQQKYRHAVIPGSSHAVAVIAQQRTASVMLTGWALCAV